MAMADDEGDSKSVEPRPLPHQQEREQEQEQQAEDPLSSTPLILPPPPSAVPPPPSADTSLVTPDVFTGEQDEKNTNRNNGFASANADPSSDNVDPSTVAANAACLDSPKLLHDVSNKEIYRVPDYSGWFSLKTIHTIERRSMSEFFDGNSISKTPKLYKQYRDFIINKYKENPGKLLTFTEVRRMLVGDVNVIKRLLDFLEHWGLINYHTAPEKKHQASTNNLNTAPSSSSETIPPGVQIVYPRIPVGISKPKGSIESNGKSIGALPLTNLASYKDAFVKSISDTMTVTSDKSIDKSNIPNCSSCGASCQEKCYGNAKKDGFLLCEECYSTGNNIIKEDFVLKKAELPTSDNLIKGDSGLKEAKVDSRIPRDDWTKEELLRLLEALTKYRENWDLIAHHVETRSKAECIMQFMKLPFGDQFIESNSLDRSMQYVMPTSDTKTETIHKDISAEQENSKATANVSMELDDVGKNFEFMPPSKRKRTTPLADTSNPILAQVAFLSAMVGPRVAAAAAQAALIALAEEDPVSSQFMSSLLPSQKDTLFSGSQITSGKETFKKEESNEPKRNLTFSKEVPHSKDVETESSQQALPSATQIRAGIATAIGAVAANAKLLADQEEREIEYLMATIIDNQLKKLCSKVEHFKELEHLLKEQHTQIERTQTQVLADWIRFSHYNYNGGRG